MELTFFKAAPPIETFKALFEIFWRLPISIVLDFTTFKHTQMRAGKP